MAGALGLTVAQLDALPERAVVLDNDGDAWQMALEGWQCWVTSEPVTSRELHRDYRPLVLLFDGVRPVLVDGQMPLPRARR